MYCEACGNELGESDNFCSKCGAQRQVKENKDRQGEVHSHLTKCPCCGERIPSFSAFCPSCGNELRSDSQTSSVVDLSQRIGAIQAQRPKKRQRAHFRDRVEISDYDAQIASLISNYPIPNTREDLLEFAILASSSIRPDELVKGTASQQAVGAAWLSKLEQANNKAILAMPGSREAERITALWQQANRKLEKAQKHQRWSPLITYALSIIFLIVVALSISLIPEKTPEQKIDSRDSELEYVAEQVEDSISNGLFDKARNKAYSISFDESLSHERHDYWEKRKQDLLDRIQEAQDASMTQYQKLLDSANSSTSK